ncbi:MAG: hypothetical protein R2825_10125 [Saprospiraceae bacterium]
MKYKLIFILSFVSIISLPLTAQNVGIGTTTPQNALDVEGGLSVGAGYSGTYTAPANGAIFQGGVGIGVTSLNALLNPKLEVNGTILSPIFLDRDNGNFGLDPSSTVTSLYAAGNLYGASLIDYNNTSYFLDLSSFSTSLNAAGSIYARELVDQDNANFYVDPSSISTSLYASGALYGKSFYDYNNANYYLDPGNTNVSMNVAGKINASGIALTGGFDANKFWDVDNNAYYLDPSSTTTSLNVAGKVVAVGDLETSDDLSVADDAFIIDNLDVNGSAFIGSTSSDEKITLTHGPSGGFQIQNSGNASFWDIWNKPDGDLGLYLNASLRGQFNYSSGIYTSASDRRLKDNIRSLGSVLPSYSNCKQRNIPSRPTPTGPTTSASSPKMWKSSFQNW